MKRITVPAWCLVAVAQAEIPLDSAPLYHPRRAICLWGLCDYGRELKQAAVDGKGAGAGFLS